MRDRILIFTDNSKPMLGGVAEYLHNLSLVLSEDYDVRVVTNVRGAEAGNPELPFAYREVGVRASMPGDRFRPLQLANTVSWRLRQWRRAVSLLREIVRERPTRLVLIGKLSPGTYPWCIACQRLGIPYSVLVYGRELIAPMRRIWDEQRLHSLRGASRVYSISSETTDLSVSLGVPRERISLLTPGIVPDQVIAPDADARLRLRYDLGLGQRRFVLSVCRLSPRKGIDLAIEAYARLADDFPDVDYVVLGTGPEETRLHALTERLGMDGRIHFLGAVDDDTKHALFAECELFVMPNRRLPTDVEGFGIVFLEAALFGKAVIGGDNGGVVDAVDGGTTGLLVDTSRGSGPVSEAMRDLLRDPDRAAVMGLRGRERTLQEFQWVRTVRGLIKDLERSVPLPPHGRNGGFRANDVPSGI